MMMIRKLLISFLIFFAIPFISYSQDKDFGIWYGITAKHDLFKKLNIEFASFLRTNNNASQIEQFYIEGGLQYKFNKHISLSAYYRLNKTQENDSKYYYRHKLYWDIRGSVPIHNLDLSASLRIMRTTKTYINDSEDLNSTYVGRIRLKTAYDFPTFPVTPYLYIEYFTPVFASSDLAVSKRRLSAGGDLKITRRSSLEAEYIFQRDYKQEDVSDINIISLNYKLKF